MHRLQSSKQPKVSRLVSRSKETTSREGSACIPEDRVNEPRCTIINLEVTEGARFAWRDPRFASVPYIGINSKHRRGIGGSRKGDRVFAVTCSLLSCSGERKSARVKKRTAEAWEILALIILPHLHLAAETFYRWSPSIREEPSRFYLAARTNCSRRNPRELPPRRIKRSATRIVPLFRYVFIFLRISWFFYGNNGSVTHPFAFRNGREEFFRLGTRI